MRMNRQGITLIETTVAMVILSAAIIAVAQLIASVATQRNVAARDTLARQEAANQMERLFAMPWGELGEDHVSQMQLSEGSRQRLPNPELAFVIGPAGGEPVQRRIRVEVTWADTSDQYRRNASLTAWRYKIEGAEE